MIRDLSVHLTRGWTGIVGANGVGKSTILKLATGVLEPQQGRVIIPDFVIYCRQRPDDAQDQLCDLISSMNGDDLCHQCLFIDPPDPFPLAQTDG